MKKTLLLTLFMGFIGLVPGQTWQELYDSTNDCWGSDWKSCIEILERALIVGKAEFSEKDTLYALTLNDLGVAYLELEKFEKALEACLKASLIAEKSLSPKRSLYGSILHNTGSVYKLIGDYEKALPFLEKALLNCEKYLGKQHPKYNNYLNNLGTLYAHMGDYERAVPLLQEALYLIEQRKNPEYIQYSSSINNLMVIYSEMGAHQEVLALLQQALNLIEKNKGTQNKEYGIIISNIGVHYEVIGDYDQALIFHKQALIHTEQFFGKKHSRYGTNLQSLGIIYQLSGEYSLALQFFNEALANIELSLGKNHKIYGDILHRMGILYMELARYREALPVLHEAVINSKNSLGEHHSNYLRKLLSLSQVYQAMDQNELAFPLVWELFDASYFRLTTQFDALNTRLQASFLRKEIHYFDQIYSFLFSHPEYKTMHEAGFDQQLLLKGFLQNQYIDLVQSLRNHPDTLVQQSYFEWILLHKQLARQYQKPLKERLDNFESLRNRADELEVGLANRSLAFRKKRKQVKWKEVQAVLDPNEAVLEFVHFPYYYKGKKTDSVLYVAFVLRHRDKCPQMIPLFEEKALEKLLSSEQKKQNPDQLYTFRGVKPRKSQPDYRNLAELVWTSIDSLFSDVKTIYYSPSGLLHRMNLGAISLDKKTHLGDEYELIQLGSARSLVFEADETTTYSDKSALLLGGIQYERNSTTSQPFAIRSEKAEDEKSELEKIRIASRGNALQWTYLAGTAVEVQNISQLLEQKGYEIDLQSGSDAREERLKSLSHSPRILHIATHGYFFPDPKDTSDLSRLDADRLPPVQLSDHPMVRSGLILAGANHAWTGNEVPEGQEDGILTAYEISRMDLSNTELVVLSACETGLGDIEGNEGVYGLQRAFKIAGAKYILMSLWQVPDQATQELMTVFYKNWLGGMEIREAFRNAQKQMRKKYKEPYYWAGFVLVE